MFDIPIVAGTVTHISKETLKTMDLESVRQLLLTIQNIVKSTCDKQCEDCPYLLKLTKHSTCIVFVAECFIWKIEREDGWKAEFHYKEG